jgi:hypothetical protein
MTLPDPRTLVEQPVRRELAWLVVRGVALVGVMAGLAVVPVAVPLDVPARDGIAVAAVVTLFGYGLAANVVRRTHDRVPLKALAEAWDRAREVDPADAWLGRAVAMWVPVGLVATLGLLVWPHFTDPNPALACAWVVLGLPPVTAAWLFASTTWTDSCRDALARAEDESQSRFRRYWANPGR